MTPEVDWAKRASLKAISGILAAASLRMLNSKSVEAGSGDTDCPIYMFHEVYNSATVENVIYANLIQGRRPVDVRTLSKIVKGEQGGLGTRFFGLTFDDSLLSQYVNALPVLERWKVPATFFTIGLDWSDGFHKYTNRAQKREIADMGFEIGWHTWNHDRNLVALRRANYGAYRVEIDARKIMSDFFGQEVVSFSSPNSMYDGILRQDLVNEGFQAAVSTALDQRAIPTIRTVGNLYSLVRERKS